MQINTQTNIQDIIGLNNILLSSTPVLDQQILIYNSNQNQFEFGFSNITGPTGLPGSTGTQGILGATGPSGTVDVDGGTGPTGAVGDDGATGPAGAVGNIGVTGPTGTVGFNGTTGPAGTVGNIGVTGPTGTVGVNGTAGPTGAAGTTGPAGVVGATGPVGIVGVAGPMGVVGATGPVGIVGVAGPIGVVGATGLVGVVGPVGANGPTGPFSPSIYYSNIVYTDTSSPNTSTAWSLYPTTRYTGQGVVINDNDPFLARKSLFLYISTSGDSWIWNGNFYETVIVPEKVPWIISKSTVDTDNVKNNYIYRKGPVLLATGNSVATSPKMDLHIHNGAGTSGVNDFSNRAGILISSGTDKQYSCVVLENLSQATATKRVSAVVNDGATTFIAPFDGSAQTPKGTHLVVDHATGYIGINLSSPISRVANTAVNIIGAAGVGVNFLSGLTYSINSAAYISAFYNQGNGPGMTIKTSSTDPTIPVFDLIANASTASNVTKKVMMAFANQKTLFGGTIEKPTSTLDTAGSFSANIVRVSGNYNMLDTDYTIVFTLNGSMSLLSPSSSIIRKIINVCLWAGVNVTVTGHINNVPSGSLTATGNAAWTLHCDGATWNII